jgi:RNA polymerase sigma factor (sigma-70 family)
VSSDLDVLWIAEVKRGNEDAAHAIWARYFPKLLQLARRRLRGLPSAAEDEEDVAAQALESFFSATHEGRFPDLDDEQGLWRLLCRISHFKAIDVVRRRAQELLVGESKIAAATDSSNVGLAHVADDEPTASFAAMMTEDFRQLLSGLNDDQLRNLALMRMEGHSNAEIASRLACSVRTVERRLALVRAKWKRQLGKSL